ncbi:MAG TPA: membrane dipeptidase [Candidatus Binatia bacterium]|nr:membrane dipeptidase [Candidatus Binatia bacterium]
MPPNRWPGTGRGCSGAGWGPPWWPPSATRTRTHRVRRDRGRARTGAERAVPVDRISRLMDVAGVEHVGIGTDMDGMPRAFAMFADYADWPSLAEALTARDSARAHLGLLLGGNDRRIFAAVTGGDRTS